MFDFNHTDTRAVPLLEQLSPEVRQCLLSKARCRSFARGETLCLQGETAETLKIVMDGWVKLYRVSENGSEAVLATLPAGQSFDELAALRRGRSSVSAEAISECRVMFLDVATICGCDNAYREINEAVLSAASDHFDGMVHQVEQLKISNGVERLTDFLLSLSGNGRGGCDLVLPFEKVVLAGMLGMKPESLSRAFGKLKAFGVKSHNRQVRIEKIEELRALSGQGSAFC
ncbi:Crp/Fnr family transcriptional regulator [Shimia sp.]|uniref:Crp/Fnr family transcriptional regulator n=1 Tax=Shimia sp. TaxID=1954381 RepID=UPI003567E077